MELSQLYPHSRDPSSHPRNSLSLFRPLCISLSLLYYIPSEFSAEGGKKRETTTALPVFGVSRCRSHSSRYYPSFVGHPHSRSAINPLTDFSWIPLRPPPRCSCSAQFTNHKLTPKFVIQKYPSKYIRNYVVGGFVEFNGASSSYLAAAPDYRRPENESARKYRQPSRKSHCRSDG